MVAFPMAAPPDVNPNRLRLLRLRAAEAAIQFVMDNTHDGMQWKVMKWVMVNGCPHVMLKSSRCERTTYFNVESKDKIAAEIALELAQAKVIALPVIDTGNPVTQSTNYAKGKIFHRRNC